MAAILKNWREAATLMLVTGRHAGKPVRFQPMDSSESQENVNENALKGDNLEILLLKRSSKSKFMPSMYVFPGGVAIDADFSEKWTELFHKVNANMAKNTFEYVLGSGAPAPMFSRSREAKFSTIPSEIAFRICAIRETFEESGVLLVRNIEDLKTFDSKFMSREPVHASAYKTKSEIFERWRKQVYADASKFINMCEELKVVPDVWSLYEWSNWLTPTGQDKYVVSGRRFDTAFFVACVPERPDGIPDKGETVHLQWGSPGDVLQDYKENCVNIAPPQLYELSRLFNFSNINNLHHFIWQREAERVERYFPVHLKCNNAFVSLLPGDDLYPEKAELEGTDGVIERQETLEELNIKFPRQHRALLQEESLHFTVSCNIKMTRGHVPPLSQIPTITETSYILDSKL